MGLGGLEWRAPDLVPRALSLLLAASVSQGREHSPDQALLRQLTQSEVNTFVLIFIFEGQRETECEWGRGRETERHRI